MTDQTDPLARVLSAVAAAAWPKRPTFVVIHTRLDASWANRAASLLTDLGSEVLRYTVASAAEAADPDYPQAQRDQEARMSRATAAVVIDTANSAFSPFWREEVRAIGLRGLPTIHVRASGSRFVIPGGLCVEIRHVELLAAAASTLGLALGIAAREARAGNLELLADRRYGDTELEWPGTNASGAPGVRETVASVGIPIPPPERMHREVDRSSLEAIGRRIRTLIRLRGTDARPSLAQHLGSSTVPVGTVAGNFTAAMAKARNFAAEFRAGTQPTHPIPYLVTNSIDFELYDTWVIARLAGLTDDALWDLFDRAEVEWRSTPSAER